MIDEVTDLGRPTDLLKFVQLLNSIAQIEIWVCLVKAHVLSLVTICILVILNMMLMQTLEGLGKAKKKKKSGAAVPCSCSAHAHSMPWVAAGCFKRISNDQPFPG